mmetsp:Transcript_3192/g.7092  ORF Transcript_3192/g.7092 Transcript_3192/m.7092 type:complete len:212 (-) Transcript_3192:436-1071(-)
MRCTHAAHARTSATCTPSPWLLSSHGTGGTNDAWPGWLVHAPGKRSCSSARSRSYVAVIFVFKPTLRTRCPSLYSTAPSAAPMVHMRVSLFELPSCDGVGGVSPPSVCCAPSPPTSRCVYPAASVCMTVTTRRQSGRMVRMIFPTSLSMKSNDGLLTPSRRLTALVILQPTGPVQLSYCAVIFCRAASRLFLNFSRSSGVSSWLTSSTMPS